MIPQKEKTKLLFRCFNFDINLFHISVLILGFSGFRGGGGWGEARDGGRRGGGVEEARGAVRVGRGQ